jgi:prophage regulatory protein
MSTHPNEEKANIARPSLERLPEVLSRYPVGKSTWWAGVKSGKYPAPVKLGGVNCTAWRSEDIDALIAEAS